MLVGIARRGHAFVSVSSMSTFEQSFRAKSRHKINALFPFHISSSSSPKRLYNNNAFSMDTIRGTPIPRSQAEQGHETTSQPKTSPSPPQHASTQSNSMENSTSTTPSSPPYLPSNDKSVFSTSPLFPHLASYNECIRPTLPSSPPIYNPFLFPKPIIIVSAQEKKERAARRTERRRVKQEQRLQARFTPLELAARKQKKLIHKQMTEAEALLFKEFCMKRELKRAKKARTALRPKEFPIIDIHADNDNNNDEGDSEREQVIITEDSGVGAETSTMNNPTFAGTVTIHDRLRAMSQALSEHAKECTRRTEPGRHSFYVDAAVSREDRMTGIAVVYKTDRRYWASEWTAKGYRICEALDQIEAEAWAIWQALQVILEKVHADRAIVKPQDPCSVAVVYSDCATALGWIRDASSKGGKVVKKIISQSAELQRLGVDIQLHWVQGHRNVPGNELADLVCKRARQPI